MRQRAKWLQDDRIIRIAGALLLISPIPNYLISITINSQPHAKWTLKAVFLGFMAASGLDWLTRVINLIVGYLMFRGKSSAWVPVLAILGFAIAKNIITFNHYYRLNPFLTISTLLTNVALFLLVFESEYRINKEIQEKLKAARFRRPAIVKESIISSPEKPNEVELPLAPEQLTKPLDNVEVVQIEAHEIIEIPIEAESPEVEIMTQEPVEVAQDNVIEIALPPPEPEPEENITEEVYEEEVEPAIVESIYSEAPIEISNMIPFVRREPAKQIRKKEFIITKGAPIDFEGYGKFAEVLYCNESELWIKPTTPIPSDIHKRAVTLEIPGQSGVIVMKFAGIKDESTLVFKVVA